MKKLNKFYLGEIIIYEENNKKLMKKWFTQENEDSLAENLKISSFREKLNHKNIIKLIKFKKIIQSKFCSKLLFIENTYEYFKTNLNDIYNKKVNKCKLSSLEMIKLMFDLIEGMLYFQNNNISHGFLCLSLIFYDIRSNCFKICEKLNHEKNINYAEYIEILNLNKSLFFSPNIWSEICKGNYLINHLPYKSDAFSLGMIFLKIGLLKNINDIYSKSKKIIDISWLEEYIQEFEESYKELPIMGKILRRFLEIDEDERWDFNNIIDILPNFKDIDNYLSNLTLNDNDKDSINLNQDRQYSNIIVDPYKNDENINKNNILDILKNEELYAIIKNEVLKREKSFDISVKNNQNKINKIIQTSNNFKRNEDLVESKQFVLKLNNNNEINNNKIKDSYNFWKNNFQDNIKYSKKLDNINFMESNEDIKYSEIKQLKKNKILPNFNEVKSSLESENYSEMNSINNIFFDKNSNKSISNSNYSNRKTLNISSKFILIKDDIYIKEGIKYRKSTEIDNKGSRIVKFKQIDSELENNNNNFVTKEEKQINNNMKNSQSNYNNDKNKLDLYGSNFINTDIDIEFYLKDKKKYDHF